MENLIFPEVDEATRYPSPPEGEGYAPLHRALLRLQPVVKGWQFTEDNDQPMVGFWGEEGFTGWVKVEGGEYNVDIYTGVCPMDAEALRMVLRHKRRWPWINRGMVVDGRVKVFLAARCPAEEGLSDLGQVLLSGFEEACWQRGELDIWWSRVRWAENEAQA